jgi:hypothetical protein
MRSNFMILCVMICATASCARETEVQPGPAHPWTSIPDDLGVNWEPIPNNLIRPVLDSAREKAAARLATDQLVELKAGEVKELLGKAVSPSPGRRFFLVRAVALEGTIGSGRTIASQTENELWVRWGTLSSKRRTVINYPVIIELNTRPKKVYVDITTAE